MVSPMFLDKQLTGFKIPYGKCVEKINWILSLIKKVIFLYARNVYRKTEWWKKMNKKKNKHMLVYNIFLNKQLTEIIIPVSKLVRKKVNILSYKLNILRI